MSSSSSSCSLIHAGAAASSVAQAVTWLDETTLAYASHAVVYLTQQRQQRRQVLVHNDDSNHMTDAVVVWQTQHLLRTQLEETNAALQITALAVVQPQSNNNDDDDTSCPLALATGFSNGSLSVWIQQQQQQQQLKEWKEFVLLHASSSSSSSSDNKNKNHPPLRSLTALAAAWRTSTRLAVVTGSSAGAVYYEYEYNNDILAAVYTQSLSHTATKTVGLTSQLLWLGTAAPRHNRIVVYYYNHQQQQQQEEISNSNKPTVLQMAGNLTGHLDWISSLAWNEPHQLLATASQDARIRLWKFNTATASAMNVSSPVYDGKNDSDNSSENDSDEDATWQEQAAEEEEQAGEARLEFTAAAEKVTRVTLEALLLGHEEMVTAVTWYPRQQSSSSSSSSLILLSSSMDRSILLWTPSAVDGIWTPLTRVGAAGGILGGSVGSSLLGYLNVTVNAAGTVLVGHAHGGSLHTWRLEEQQEDQPQHQRPESINAATTAESKETTETNALEEEEAGESLLSMSWRAQPGVTGHFRGVVDLSWETHRGDYLVSVSQDQTCRLWAPLAVKSDDWSTSSTTTASSSDNKPIWLEMGRPQVHGYDLAAVASISTAKHPHLLVTAADEKELRAFDAPVATCNLLQQACGIPRSATDKVERVERAYIPSLGLSNKASAADRAEEAEEEGEDSPEGNENDASNTTECPIIGTVTTTSNAIVRLPLERDLGAVSLWPEIRKLFGHQSELYCLTSTLAARSSQAFAEKYNDSAPILVASSCKARDVEGAAIRLWNVHDGKCHQVLQGGHKSTIATMAFSPCGTYLASSGKDRRLCLWKQDHSSDSRQFSLAWAQDGAHKRIIWSVHFCPWNSDYLVSGSRDGCIKVWEVQDSADTASASVLHSFAPAFTINGKPDSVTALSIRPTPFHKEQDVAVLAVGLESGRLELWNVPLRNAEDVKPALLCSVAESLGHRATVTKLAWKPQRGRDGECCELLASSSLDHSVRILKFQ